MNSIEKKARYEKTLSSIEEMIDGRKTYDGSSTVSCELYHAFDH